MGSVTTFSMINQNIVSLNTIGRQLIMTNSSYFNIKIIVLFYSKIMSLEDLQECSHDLDKKLSVAVYSCSHCCCSDRFCGYTSE